MSNLNVALTLSLNDRLVAPLQRALAEVQKGVQAIEKDLMATNKASGQANATMASMQGPAMATKQAAELARNTQNAIGLAERLRTTFAGVGTVIKGVAAGAAGFQAAKYVMAAPLKSAASYEKQLADAANIAYSGMGTAERRAGMQGMDSSVKEAVRLGGGSRESALVGMNALFAADIDKNDVKALLPSIQKYSTAGNANPENIANLVIYGLRSLKLDAKDIPLMLDKTLASTNKGSMELDNLAKWMPQVGAAGGAAGMVGMKGYEQMLAGVQTSRLTAGTKDEAGTNFKDLLSMLNGHALMTAAKKMGIDVAGSLAKHIGDGGSAISGAVMLADHVVNQDPRQQALQRQLKASGLKFDEKGQPVYSSEQQQIMAQQATLFAGSSLGKLFHNQQSMQALVALRNNRDYFKANIEATGEANGQIGEGNMALIKTTTDFKNQQSENEKLFALTDGLNPVNSGLGKLAEATTDLYRKYPGYSTVVELAKWAIGGLAAAAAGAGAALGILGLLAKSAPAAAAVAAAGGAAPSAAGAAAAGGLAAVAPLAGAGLVAGGLVLGAGYLMSEQMNSTQGLTDRMNARGQRLQELQELARLDPGGKYDPEIDRLRAERDALRDKYGAQVGGGRGVVNPDMNVNVYLDGRQIQSSVNGRNDRDARRN